MADMLSKEQKEQFVSMLGGAEQQNEALSPEQQQQAVDEGVEMAKADLGEAADAAPVTPPAEPAEDPNAAALSELGVSSVAELVEKFKELSGRNGEYRDMLSNLVAMQQAVENQQELSPDDPMASVRKAVREEMAPLYEKMSREARNKLVQEAWGKDAENMPGLADAIPEITQFIKEHPELAVSEDGLHRAYDSVRSKKYRSDEELLSDDSFIQKAASNERVRNAVLEKHLADLARNGEEVPPSIGSGGNTPLTGQKKPPNSMEQAKRQLLSRLGGTK